MSFTDKLFHLQFIFSLDQIFPFISSTSLQVIDLEPSWPYCFIVVSRMHQNAFYIWERVLKTIQNNDLIFCRQDRESMVVSTKVRFCTDNTNVNNGGLSRKHIVNSCEKSLERLKTSYVDLYQVIQYQLFTLSFCTHQICIRQLVKHSKSL